MVIAVLAIPLIAPPDWQRWIALAAISGIIGLSVNVMAGRAGLVSLGHQAFVGVGAVASAWATTRIGGMTYLFALLLAGAVGSTLGLAAGVGALRGRLAVAGVAVTTLALGVALDASDFGWRLLAFGGPAVRAPRPAAFQSDRAYAYLCIGILVLAALVEWRLTSTKAGRAMATARRDPQVAASLGINVTAYRLLALSVAGFLAGVAGSLVAHLIGAARPSDFTVAAGLTWMAMAAVGGLRSRAGVVIASAFFAVLPVLLPGGSLAAPLLSRSVAVLVVATVLFLPMFVAFPAGLGGLLLPLRRWLAGGPFRIRRPLAAGVPRPAPEPHPGQMGSTDPVAVEASV